MRGLASFVKPILRLFEALCANYAALREKLVTLFHSFNKLTEDATSLGKKNWAGRRAERGRLACLQSFRRDVICFPIITPVFTYFPYLPIITPVFAC